MINRDDFEKIEMRIGTVLSVELFEKAVKPAYRLSIDFGEWGIKKSSAQITALYTASALTGKQVVAVINFPPKQIANFFSECLVLGVYNHNSDVVLLKPDGKIKNGSRVG